MIDKSKPNAPELCELLDRHNLSNNQVAFLIRASRTSVLKWKIGTQGIPLSAWRILQLTMKEISIEDILSEMPESFSEENGE